MTQNAGKGYKWGDAIESNWIDISLPFHTNMWHWPTDPPAKVERIKDRDKGDPVSLMELQFVDHTGTHVDAPLHFIAGGLTIDKMPLNATIGRARVIEIKDTESITVEELAPYHIRRGERILFKTLNSSKYFCFPLYLLYFCESFVNSILDIMSPSNFIKERLVHSTSGPSGIYIIILIMSSSACSLF